MAQLPPFDKEDMKRRMKGAVATLKHEFAGLRTGRANPAILEPVMVEAYGNPMPLNQVGTISAPEPRLLTMEVLGSIPSWTDSLSAFPFRSSMRSGAANWRNLPPNMPSTRASLSATCD